MPAELPEDLRREVRRILTDLRSVRLAAPAWPLVAGDLNRLVHAVERGDDELVRQAVVPVSQAAFEGKVRGRLAGSNRTAAYVTATKQTSALPVVGAVSAAILVVVGFLLGGWVVAAGTALFGLFIFAVAYAGSNSHREPVRRRQRAYVAPTVERAEPLPGQLAEAISRLEQSLQQPRLPGEVEGGAKD